MILLTRPLSDSLEVVDLLGGSYCFVVEPSFDVYYKGVNVDLDKYDSIIVTSHRALRNVQLKNKKIFAVGRKSTTHICKISNDISVFQSVSELLNFFKKHGLLKSNIIYLRGNIISCDLKQDLGKYGCNIAEAQTYNVRYNKFSDKLKESMSNRDIKTAVFFSQKAYQHFFEEVQLSEQLKNGMRKMKIIVPFKMEVKGKEDFKFFDPNNLNTLVDVI